MTDPKGQSPKTDVITLYELADRWGVSYTTVYEQARTNTLPLPVFRIGRRYLVSRNAYEELMGIGHEPFVEPELEPEETVNEPPPPPSDPEPSGDDISVPGQYYPPGPDLDRVNYEVEWVFKKAATRPVVVVYQTQTEAARAIYRRAEDYEDRLDYVVVRKLYITVADEKVLPARNWDESEGQS